MGEPRRDGPGPPGLLPVPLLDHGAVGRPGRRLLHRRHADRRRPRPQRPAPGPLVADQGRPGRAGQRGRRARHPGRPTSSPRAGCSRAGCSSSTPPPGTIVSDEEVKGALAAEQPYDDWLHAGLVHLPSLPERRRSRPSHESVVRRQMLFGYTEEELRVLVTPMASSGAEPIGSMGTDTPVAALSDRSRLLYDYFGQLFAQVTNPPLDAIREELVTSLGARHRCPLPPGPALRQPRLARPVRHAAQHHRGPQRLRQRPRPPGPRPARPPPRPRHRRPVPVHRTAARRRQHPQDPRLAGTDRRRQNRHRQPGTAPPGQPPRLPPRRLTPAQQPRHRDHHQPAGQLRHARAA